MGARQFVVQEALEITLSCSVNVSWFTPITTVGTSPLAGAEMITRPAPASRCLPALSLSVKNPVDSITTSTPRDRHGNSTGSRSASTMTSLPSTASDLSLISTLPGYFPCVESYFNRCPSVPASVRSFTATTSMRALRIAARKTSRPIRPNPLMATLIAILSTSRSNLNPSADRRRGYAGECDDAPRQLTGRSAPYIITCLRFRSNQRN